MIFNKSVLFIHPPKMGGMSLTNYLISNLKGQVYLYLPIEAKEATLLGLKRAGLKDELIAKRSNFFNFFKGGRHETLWQAEEILQEKHGINLQSFKHIIIPSREPVSLEKSHYRYLRTPKVLSRRKDKDVKLAQLTFSEFCLSSGYFKLPRRKDGSVDIAQYYTDKSLNCPNNLRRIDIKELADKIYDFVPPRPYGIQKLQHKNKTDDLGEKIDITCTENDVSVIYKKYEYLSQFYS